MPVIKRLIKNNIASKFGMLALVLVLVGCASGVPYGTAKSNIPAVKADMGRIYVYRSINPLAVFKPRVFTLNGKHIADTYAATIFYHDVTSGTHVVNYNEGQSNLSINVPKGGVIYLKYSIVDDSVAAGNTAVTIMDKNSAEAELTGVHLIEKIIRNPDEMKKLKAGGI
jgi:hypothetical protein